MCFPMQALEVLAAGTGCSMDALGQSTLQNSLQALFLRMSVLPSVQNQAIIQRVCSRLETVHPEASSIYQALASIFVPHEPGFRTWFRGVLSQGKAQHTVLSTDLLGLYMSHRALNAA